MRVTGLNPARGAAGLLGELVVAVADHKAKRLPDGQGVSTRTTEPPVLPTCRSDWVQPARCTRRLPNSMKKSTYSRCRKTVSTVKKSTARIVRRCASKKLAPCRTDALGGPCQAV